MFLEHTQNKNGSTGQALFLQKICQNYFGYPNHLKIYFRGLSNNYQYNFVPFY